MGCGRSALANVAANQPDAAENIVVRVVYEVHHDQTKLNFCKTIQSNRTGPRV